MTSVPGWAVVDLFCGIGGLSHGFRQAGFNVVAGVDADETCRYAYETNNDAKFVGNPLEEVSGDEIGTMFPDEASRILIGCAPCTPFSAYTAANGRSRDKWSLVDLFMDRVCAVDPAVVSMENVARLTSFNGGRVFNTFLKRLRDAAYKVSPRVVNAADYGVPQERSRLVVLASKLGPIDIPASTSDKRPTVRGAIGHMPALNAGDISPADTITVPAACHPATCGESARPSLVDRGPNGRIRTSFLPATAGVLVPATRTSTAAWSGTGLPPRLPPVVSPSAADDLVTPSRTVRSPSGKRLSCRAFRRHMASPIQTNLCGSRVL